MVSSIAGPGAQPGQQNPISSHPSAARTHTPLFRRQVPSRWCQIAPQNAQLQLPAHKLPQMYWLPRELQPRSHGRALSGRS